jgi:hypothetical protein
MSNRDKLAKVFGEGAFGLADVPERLGHKQIARTKKDNPPGRTREDDRSWKRRRKTRWRPAGA